MSMFGPQIKTALPFRRYQLGEFQVTALADIDSTDDRQYACILAFVPEGRGEPLLYLSSERDARDEARPGAFLVRVWAPAESRDFGSDPRWSDREVFVADALAIASKLLELGDEEPRVLG